MTHLADVRVVTAVFLAAVAAESFMCWPADVASSEVPPMRLEAVDTWMVCMPLLVAT